MNYAMNVEVHVSSRVTILSTSNAFINVSSAVYLTFLALPGESVGLL